MEDSSSVPRPFGLVSFLNPVYGLRTATDAVGRQHKRYFIYPLGFS
jgi:hypothetical protein